MNCIPYILKSIEKTDTALYLIEQLAKTTGKSINRIRRAGIFLSLGTIVTGILFKIQDKEIENLRSRVRSLEEEAYNK